MPEYISRDAAISKIRDEGVLGGDYDAYEREEDVVDTLKSIPAADVVEVRHGRWIHEPGHIPHCSECGRYSDDADTGEAICCPFCLARMNRGQDDA